MSFWTKIRDKVLKPVAKVANGVGKVVGASGIPVLSSVGQLLDTAIPDSTFEKMQEKVSEQGVIKVDKIEETILNNAPITTTNEELKKATILTAQALATTNPTANVDDTKALTTLTLWDKYKLLWKQKNKMFIAAHVLIVGACIYFYNNSKPKKKRRY